jgi:hypothetical protein
VYYHISFTCVLRSFNFSKIPKTILRAEGIFSRVVGSIGSLGMCGRHDRDQLWACHREIGNGNAGVFMGIFIRDVDVIK